MYLVVGLGNVGNQYKGTRHNIGFDVLELLSEKYNISLNRTKFKGVYGEGIIASEKVILLKPSTYMNASGESIMEAVNFYKIPKENIIVIQDDISIPVGKIRLRPKGSAGGHNGLKSIILQLSSDEFPRIKIGVGEPKEELVNHVLGKFSKEEAAIVSQVSKIAVEGVEVIIKEGVAEAMNKINGSSIV